MAETERAAAIISGGTRGIGAAIANGLLKRGVRCLVNGRGRDAEVEANLAEFARFGEAELLPGNAADPDTAAALVDQARASFGRVDYVVPAAGGAYPGKITELAASDWEEAFRVHVHAVFHLFRAAYPLLAKRGGSFLMIGSVAGVRGCPSAIGLSGGQGRVPADGAGARPRPRPRGRPRQRH
jgi:NAD(P)-dependent dehydrogenase (short-subunit alcohol dehydrogenase family)